MDSYRQSHLALHAADGGQVEFEAVRKHILGLYRGVKVAHSFVTANGHHVDCIPIEQQPTLRHPALKGHVIQSTPPPPSPAAAPPPSGGSQAPGRATPVTPHLVQGTRDQYGNEMFCPVGTIPMRRITLEEMTRFKTLKEFFRKSPGGAGHPGQRRVETPKPDIHDGHRYATAFQAVNCTGGSSYLNIWNPTTVSGGMSLSQQWYSGGSFSDHTIQTVEGGWQVLPSKYGDSATHLFIYWTADAYQNTGCYNLDCQGFVQVDNSWVLGGSLSSVSTTGGTQYEINMQWQRDSTTGNWWLFLQGHGSRTAVGYYPQALYGAGPMASNATTIEFGGEVYGQPTSGQMGSGAFAADGWQKAAYQRQNWYIDTGGTSTSTSLTGIESDPTCYTEQIGTNGGNDWIVYFFFGGPECG
jgi:hypothetical protein